MSHSLQVTLIESLSAFLKNKKNFVTRLLAAFSSDSDIGISKFNELKPFIFITFVACQKQCLDI